MILRVGLTGGTASGKSTVAGLLTDLGCVVVDADRIVHDLYRPGQEGYHAVLKRFGAAILAPDGTIDRQKLASIAFVNPKTTAELNALIHPIVIAKEEELLKEQARQDQDQIFVVEATLLLEAGGRERYDRIVVIEASPELMLQRAVQRGMDRADAELRIQRQMSAADRLRFADYVIHNDGELEDLATKTREVYRRLEKDLAAKKLTPS